MINNVNLQPQNLKKVTNFGSNKPYLLMNSTKISQLSFKFMNQLNKNHIQPNEIKCNIITAKHLKTRACANRCIIFTKKNIKEGFLSLHLHRRTHFSPLELWLLYLNSPVNFEKALGFIELTENPRETDRSGIDPVGSYTEDPTRE